MNINLIKISATVMVLVLVTGCGKTQVSDASNANSPAQAGTSATSPVVPTPAASGPVALVDYDATAAVPEGGNCALDGINGSAPAGASAKVGSEVTFGGWIADASNQVPTDARLILKSAQKAYAAPLVAGGARADVAAALHAETAKLSGYNVLTKLNVAPGTYDLSIVYGSGNAAASCSLHASLMTVN